MNAESVKGQPKQRREYAFMKLSFENKTYKSGETAESPDPRLSVSDAELFRSPQASSRISAGEERVGVSEDAPEEGADEPEAETGAPEHAKTKKTAKNKRRHSDDHDAAVQDSVDTVAVKVSDAAISKKPHKSAARAGLAKKQKEAVKEEAPVEVKEFRTAARLLQLLRNEVEPEPCGSTKCAHCNFQETRNLTSVRQSHYFPNAPAINQEEDYSKDRPPLSFVPPASGGDTPVYPNPRTNPVPYRPISSPSAKYGGMLGASRRMFSAVPIAPKQKQRFKYWRVNYANPSSRKHKIWEDDGVLVVEGNVMTLLKSDHETYITKKAGCSQKEIDQLDDDWLLIVGCKEVKILDGMTEEEFRNNS
ncbi:uncharacterized protein LOC129582089 [Paramacrobiotus metropolitanus]|uniref:uncharacterized protein LOC129582089 n=1 Tax=Paramacrobiotus metropolitanus TaxID=2943436 RepID=UPI002445ABED|nr:uncharacterized protein LOC129582089 [Paramacrobiotus metropolitanus]